MQSIGLFVPVCQKQLDRPSFGPFMECRGRKLPAFEQGDEDFVFAVFYALELLLGLIGVGTSFILFGFVFFSLQIELPVNITRVP